MERSKLNDELIENLGTDDGYNLNPSRPVVDSLESEPLSSEVPSWEALADLLAGFLPEDIEPLTAARELELVYPLIHALTRGAFGGPYAFV